WVQDNKVDGAPSERPDVFYCIHKLLAHPVESGLRFMRVHEEVYWRDPGETTWRFSTPGLPSNFGFAAAIHPRDTSTAYCIPLDGMKRTASPFGIGVYRTTDKGKSWDRLDKGLPEGAPMESVREGMHNDRLDPMGLYFGTANGDVWASKNEGDSWSRIAQYLPDVTTRDLLEYDEQIRHVRGVGADRIDDHRPARVRAMIVRVADHRHKLRSLDDAHGAAMVGRRRDWRRLGR